MTDPTRPDVTSAETHRLRVWDDPGAWLLVVACVSLAGLFAPVLSAGPLALDEHGSYWMLDSVGPATIYERCMEYGAVPPLNSWMQWTSLKILGKTEFALRAPLLACCFAALYAVYLIGKQVGNSLTGGVAACLLAWNPGVLDEVRIARCYGLVVFLACGLVLATLKWRSRINSVSRGLLWGLFALALPWTHYMTAPLVLISWGIIVISVLLTPDSSRPRALILGISAILFVSCLPLLPALQRLQSWSPFLNMNASERPVWEIVSSYWWCSLPLGGLATVLLTWKSNRRPEHQPPPDKLWSPAGWILLASSLLPLVALAIGAVGDYSSLANPRYLTVYAPAGAVWGALLLARSGSWRVAIIGMLVTIVTAWINVPHRPWQLVRLGAPAEQHWKELGSVIAEHGAADDLILVQGGLVESSLVPLKLDDPLFLEYTACRMSRFYADAPLERVALPFFWNEQTLAEFGSLVEARHPSTIWIAAATDTDLNRNSLAGAQVLTARMGYDIVETQSWPTATLIKLHR